MLLYHSVPTMQQHDVSWRSKVIALNITLSWFAAFSEENCLYRPRLVKLYNAISQIPLMSCGPACFAVLRNFIHLLFGLAQLPVGLAAIDAPTSCQITQQLGLQNRLMYACRHSLVCSAWWAARIFVWIKSDFALFCTYCIGHLQTSGNGKIGIVEVLIWPRSMSRSSDCFALVMF